LVGKCITRAIVLRKPSSWSSACDFIQWLNNDFLGGIRSGVERAFMRGDVCWWKIGNKASTTFFSSPPYFNYPFLGIRSSLTKIKRCHIIFLGQIWSSFFLMFFFCFESFFKIALFFFNFILQYLVGYELEFIVFLIGWSRSHYSGH
jgi:hypothetical protein